MNKTQLLESSIIIERSNIQRINAEILKLQTEKLERLQQIADNYSEIDQIDRKKKQKEEQKAYKAYNMSK
tara:strand:- start:220 stop:429 length:210 start_codon:yes stop_codon:yes gene_type:complete